MSYIQDIDALIEVFQRSKELDVDYSALSAAVVDRMRLGGKVMTAGNGGSACHALHLAEELIGRYSRNRAPLPSLCLTGDTPTMTCVANDFGYQHVFSRSLIALGRRGDVLLLFSTSGNSENLVEVARVATRLGILVCAFLGKDGGELKLEADYNVTVPSSESSRVQEVHQFLLHKLVEDIEREICPL